MWDPPYSSVLRFSNSRLTTILPAERRILATSVVELMDRLRLLQDVNHCIKNSDRSLNKHSYSADVGTVLEKTCLGLWVVRFVEDCGVIQAFHLHVLRYTEDIKRRFLT